MPEIVDTETWYEAATRLVDRAEDLKNPTMAYVDTVFLESLQSKKNQIVFGRRGTGKTHLFRRLEEELLNHFEHMRMLPIYVDAATLAGVTTSVKDPAAVALTVYVELVKHIVRKLSLFIDGRIRPSVLDWLFPGPKRSLLFRTRRSIRRLDELLTQGKVRLLPVGTASIQLDNLSEQASKLRLAAGWSADFTLSDPGSLGVELGASGEKLLKVASKQVTTQKIGGETYLPFVEITEIIRELLSMLDNASLVILIDEWSSVGGADVQPLLAQLLRLTAKGGIYLKIACIPGRTRLLFPGSPSEGRSPIGLELGDDIAADVNLDSIVFNGNDIKQIASFFVALLYRHMAIEIEEIWGISVESFTEYLLGDRINNPRVLAELCHASGAVPRDFINIFRRAVIAQRRAGALMMTVAHVRSAARDVYEDKRSNLSGRDVLPLLDRIYQKVVVGQRTYFFLVASPLVSHPSIVELFTARLIHKTPAKWIDPASGASYVYFMIDYGTNVDRLRQAGTRAWEELTRRTNAFTPHRFLALPKTNQAALQGLLDRLDESREETRLDSEPNELIIDADMIEQYGTA